MGKGKEIVRYDSVVYGFILWLTMFFLPVWGVVLPIAAILIWLTTPLAGTPQGFTWLTIVAVAFLAGCSMMVALKNNRIVLGDEFLSFPPYVAGRRKWADLRLAKLRRRSGKHWLARFAGDSLRLYFRDGQVVDLRLKGMDRQGLALLLSSLPLKAPQCRRQNSLFLLAGQLASGSQSQEDNAVSGDVVEIKYSPYQGIRNFIKFLMTYEKYYWRVWLPTILTPVLLASPYLVLGFLSYFLHWNLPPDCMACLEPWNRFMEFLGNTVGRGFYEGSQTFYGFVTHPLGAALLFGICGFSLFAFLNMLRQPYGLSLSRDGLSVRRRLFFLPTRSLAFAWSELKAVRFIKPPGTTMPERWSIGFETRDRQTFKFKVSAIASAGGRQRLMAAVDRWAPATASREPELLETLLPSQARSYTELWLQSLAAPPKRERLAPLEPSTTLQHDRYRIVRQLGVGGQGVAYLAEQKSYTAGQEGGGEKTSVVVLKEFILPVYVDRNVRRQSLERFENEAAMLKRLEHERIVKLIDYFVEDHRAYLVLEHIDGVSLRTLIEKEGPQANERVIGLATQMCEILQYLHGLSPPVVHRDFTPDNLILGSDGVLKLIDFNVAQQSESTTTGTVVGKHAYLPPEQFRGKPTALSDIYAFGATLFFLIAGRDPEPLTKSHPLLSREDTDILLEEIVAGATELDQCQRIGGAGKIMDMLRAGKPAVPPDNGEEAEQLPRRQKARTLPGKC